MRSMEPAAQSAVNSFASGKNLMVKLNNATNQAGKGTDSMVTGAIGGERWQTRGEREKKVRGWINRKGGRNPLTVPLLTPKTTELNTTISLAKLWTKPRFVNRSSRVVSKETLGWTLIGKMREWIVKEGKAIEGGIVMII